LPGWVRRQPAACLRVPSGPVEYTVRRRLRQQGFDLAAQVFIPATGDRKKCGPFLRLPFRRRLVDFLDASPAGWIHNSLGGL
jgi:hypothetical protein